MGNDLAGGAAGTSAGGNGADGQSQPTDFRLASSADLPAGQAVAAWSATAAMAAKVDGQEAVGPVGAARLSILLVTPGLAAMAPTGLRNHHVVLTRYRMSTNRFAIVTLATNIVDGVSVGQPSVPRRRSLWKYWARGRSGVPIPPREVPRFTARRRNPAGRPASGVISNPEITRRAYCRLYASNKLHFSGPIAGAFIREAR